MGEGYTVRSSMPNRVIFDRPFDSVASTSPLLQLIHKKPFQVCQPVSVKCTATEEKQSLPPPEAMHIHTHTLPPLHYSTERMTQPGMHTYLSITHRSTLWKYCHCYSMLPSGAGEVSTTTSRQMRSCDWWNLTTPFKNYTSPKIKPFWM